MRVQHQCWSGLVAAVLSGLVSVTAVAAAGEQFLPVLSTREGAQRSNQIPLANGFIDYLTLLNARDGGINGVLLVWEECETVWDVTRGVECYERLKTQGPTGAAAFQVPNTPLVNALLERATHDQIPIANGFIDYVTLPMRAMAASTACPWSGKSAKPSRTSPAAWSATSA